MAESRATHELRQVREARWQARPVQAAVVRGLVLAIPLGAGIAAGYAVSRLLTGASLGVLVVAMIGASTGAILITERVARRLLPLAMLLRLTLVFPDHAPARVRVALRAGNLRRLRRWAEAEHEAGAPGDAASAAERVLSLVTALGAHDRRTRGHSERVRALVEVLGQEMGLAPEELDLLRWSGLLHDLGKLSVPSSILNKPAKPTAEEWAALERHPAEGIRIAGPLVPWLGEWAHGIDEHHERWDGDGYPHGHAGEEISRAGRIVAVADAFECMTEVRSYQRPRSYAEARAEITRCAGSHFDPAVVRALQKVSLPRLHWIMGPLSWLAQVPFLGAVPRTGMEIANLTSAATLGTVVQVATAAALLTGAGAPATLPAFAQPVATTSAGNGAMHAGAPMESTALGVPARDGLPTDLGANTTTATQPAVAGTARLVESATGPTRALVSEGQALAAAADGRVSDATAADDPPADPVVDLLRSPPVDAPDEPPAV